jgi:hypothetical protein
LFKYLSAILLFSGLIYSQLLKIPLIISDGAVNGTDTLYFGIDPSATDGIDSALGEYQLPPVPPVGIFDCRFIGSDIAPPLQFGEGLNSDYRQGNASFTGSKIHEIKFQRGAGSSITIFWQLSNGVTGRIYDLFGGILVNDSIFGNGNINITNNGINKLFLRVNYAAGSIGIKNITGFIPEKFILYQNYPNPFNPVTNIRFGIAEASNVKLTIYDILGNIIAIPVNQQLKPGIFEIRWDASGSPNGVYYCCMQAGNFSNTKKMILLK